MGGVLCACLVGRVRCWCCCGRRAARPASKQLCHAWLACCADPCVWSDALELSNALCCELALGGGGGAAAAAHYLLTAVVAPGEVAAS